MDKLDPVRALLSVIAEAVHVCQKNRNVPREWMAEAEFCSRLRATLGSVKDCSPIKGNFPHAQELNHLIQVVLQTLNYFYNDLVPGLPSLQKGCAPGASPALLSQLEGQLGGSVIPRTKALREQADRYLQGIDTLLLLYVINALGSQPNVLLSEKRLHDLHNITRRAQVGASQGLDQLTKQFAAKALRIEEQQRCLIAIRRDVENHWAAQKAAANRVSNDAGKTGQKPAAVQARPPGQSQDPNARHGQPAVRPATQNLVPQPVPPGQAPARTSKSSTPKGSRPAQPHAASYPDPGTHTTNIINVGVHAAAHSATNISQPAQPRPSPAPAAYSATSFSQPAQPRPSPASGPGGVPPRAKDPGPKRKQVAPSGGPPPAVLTPGGQKKPAASASQQPGPQSQHGPVNQPKQTSKPAQKAAPQAKQKPGKSQAQGQSSSRSGGGQQQSQSGGNVTYVTNNTHQHTSNQSIDQSVNQQSIDQSMSQQSLNQYSNDQYSNNQYSNNQYSNDQYWNDQYSNNQYSNTEYHMRPESPASSAGRTSSDPGNADRLTDSNRDHRPNQPATDYDARWASQGQGVTPGQDDYQGQRGHQGQNSSSPQWGDYQEEDHRRGQDGYDGQRGYPSQPEPDAYALRDLAPAAQPAYTSPPPPTYYPGDRGGGGGADRGYPAQAPMRTSADSGRSRSKAGAYVGAGAVGAAAVGAGAALAASGEEEDGESECCGDRCCGDGCCGDGCGGDGCCGDGCCGDGCCGGGCCGGGCCGDDDDDGKNEGCCVIM